MGQTPKRGLLLAYLLLLALAAALPYASSLGGEFVLDDIPLIAADQSIRDVSGIPSMFTRGFISGVDDHTSYYRPMVTISYTLNYVISGMDPQGYKVINLLLHIIATFLVFFLARSLVSGTGAALLAGLFFAVHPAHPEAVSWISGRTDLLAAVFGLGAVICFVRRIKGCRRTWLVASVLLFTLAILSKESAVIIPVLLASLVWFLYPQRSMRRLIYDIAPFVAITIVYVLARKFALGYSLTQYSVTSHLIQTTAHAPWFLLDYLKMLIVPLRAEPLYMPGAADSVAEAAAAVVGMIIVFASPLALRRRMPMVAFGLLWTLLGVALVLNIVPIMGLRPAARFVYWPSVGLSLIFGLAASKLLALRPKPVESVWPMVAGAAVVGMLAYSAAQVYAGAPVWTSEAAVVKRMIDRYPSFYKVRILAAMVHENRGNVEEAIEQYKAAAALRPDDPMPHSKLVILHRINRDVESAAIEAEEIVRLFPDDASAHNQLGGTLADKGDIKGAIESFTRASQLAPDDPVIRFNLARAYAKNRDFDSAVKEYRKGLSLDPQNKRARLELNRIMGR